MSPLETEGTEAINYGTKYEGGCLISECRLGKKPIGDVLVDRKLLKQAKWDIGTLRPDIFVSEKLRSLIVSNGLTGVAFNHKVKDFKGREMSDYFVMEFENVLPKMASITWLINEKCNHQRYSKCGHQVMYLRSDVQYERKKMHNVRDLNLSAEYVDNFRLQEIIVSQKVRKLFKEYRIHVGFFPVALLD
jgi:hypothetical protein